MRGSYSGTDSALHFLFIPLMSFAALSMLVSQLFYFEVSRMTSYEVIAACDEAEGIAAVPRLRCSLLSS